METKTINVVKPFTLTIVRDKVVEKIPVMVGVQEVDEDIADHWYTQAHCSELPKPAKAPPTTPKA